MLTTRGDQVLDTPLPLVGGKGLFTAELEDALRGGLADVAVHSLKDLPLESSAGLALGATPRRGNPADALMSRAGHTFESLPRGATVGTSSRRRATQLRLRLRGRVLAGDGSAQVDVCAATSLGTRPDEGQTAARDLRRGLAEAALAQGAASLLGDTA